MPQSAEPRKLDPFRILELPAAVFVINITLFTILWKSIGISWLPLGLGEAFGDIFAEGYYARDMERNEAGYNLFFFFLYGILGTAAQVASIWIWWIRRKGSESRLTISRWTFGLFHLAIATYHVLFVFQVVKGKMILDGMASWQMLATQVLYVATLLMSLELLFSNRETFFRRKVCMDVVSCCNLIPFLVFWIFALTSFKNPQLSKLVEHSCFTIIPLAVMAIEWGTFAGFRVSKTSDSNMITESH